MPIIQEKLDWNIGLVPSFWLSFHPLIRLSLSKSQTSVRHTDPSNCQESRMLPLELDLKPRRAPVHSARLYARLITAANTSTRPFQTQPAWLLCDREANLLCQYTLLSRHETLAPFHQPAYYIRISLHACHNNTFTANECGAFCPKLAVTCFSKGHK